MISQNLLMPTNFKPPPPVAPTPTPQPLQTSVPQRVVEQRSVPTNLLGIQANLPKARAASPRHGGGSVNRANDSSGFGSFVGGSNPHRNTVTAGFENPYNTPAESGSFSKVNKQSRNQFHSLKVTNDQQLDKYGFQHDEVSLHDAFELRALKFREGSLPESALQQVCLQDRHLWVFSQRNHYLVKCRVPEQGNPRAPDQILDDPQLRRLKLQKMYVGENGVHCFMLAEHELYFNHWNSEQIHQIQVNPNEADSSRQQRAFKSIDILKFEDDNELDDSRVYEILLGSEDGHIFHGVMEINQKYGTVEVFKEFTSVMETPEYSPILDIKIARVKGNYLVLAVSATSLYQFIGKGGVEEVFRNYSDDPKKVQEHTIVISAKQGGNVNRESSVLTDTAGNPLSVQSKLQLVYDNKQVAGFGWLNDNQFCYGQYNSDNLVTEKSIQQELVLKQKSLKSIQYLKKEGDQPVEDELPSGFAITLFHIVFQYPTNLTVVSKISREIVYSNNFEAIKPIRGIQMDLAANDLMVYFPKETISIANLKGEDQDAWKYYLKKGIVKKALANCRTPKQKAYVSGIYAEQLFSGGRYELAAQYYARSHFSFETVTLKFLSKSLEMWLKVYLEQVLKLYASNNPQHAPQRLLLCTWIVELKLSEINQLNLNFKNQVNSGAQTNDLQRQIIAKQLEDLKLDFRNFMKSHEKDIDQDTIFQMLQSHGKIDECIQFAEDLRCFQKLIVHFINKQEFAHALVKLIDIDDGETRNHQMLKYCSILLKEVPEQTLDALESERFRTIDIPQLMPALMGVPIDRMDRARRFVTEYCIKQRRRREKSVHNLAFYLYAQHENADELLRFLQREEINKEQGQAIFFEVDYALNVCKQKEEKLEEQIDNISSKDRQNQLRHKVTQMKKAQIILYGILNLYSKAVKLALECQDIDAAKEYANKPSENKMRKKLWMKIAKALFKGNKGESTKKEVRVEEALKIIREHSVLKVEDLLHLFPSEAKVEEMKQHLCQCLDDYENKIRGLRGQIEQHSANAELLRTQKRSQRNKHITINPGQTCDICFGTVFDREFYIFPCQHAFHRECIFSVIKEYQAKNPAVGAVLRQVKSLFGEIDAVKAKAHYIQQSSAPSSSTGSGLITEDPSRDPSFISSLKDMFSSVSFKGGVPTGMGGPGNGNINNYTTQILAKKDQHDIRVIFNRIDELMKRECLFCGLVLIDMIDNDIVDEGGEGTYEFFDAQAQAKSSQPLFGVDEETEFWEIK